MNFAYLRVSTKDKQEFARQEFALKDYNIDKIFEEKISGTKKATTRPEFEKLLKESNKGDTIYFESMSRMARSMQDLIETTNFLANQKGVKVVFVKENITVGGEGLDALSQLVFNIMGAFAQFERDIISDRTKQSLQAKKEQGIKLGRKETYSKDTKNKIIAYYSKGHTMQETAKRFEVSVASVGRFIKESKCKNKEILNAN